MVNTRGTISTVTAERTYDLVPNTDTPGDRWTLVLDDGTTDYTVAANLDTATQIATAVVPMTGNVVDLLTADGSNGYKIIDGDMDKLTIVDLNGDDNFDVKLIITTEGAISTVAAERNLQRISVTDPPPSADAWALEIAATSGGAFSSQATSSQATLANAISNDFTTLTSAAFTAFLEGGDLIIERNAGTDFDVRIQRTTTTTTTTNVSGTVATVVLSGAVYSNVDWTLNLGSNSETYEPAANSETTTNVAAGLATDISALSGFFASATTNTITIIRPAGGAIAPSVSVAFDPATTSGATYKGDLNLKYSQTVTLEPALTSQSVNTNDRWNLSYTDVGGAKTLEFRGQDKLKINSGSTTTITAATNLNELAARLNVELTSPGTITATASTAGIVDIKDSSGAPIIFNAITHTSRVVARDGTRSHADVSLTGVYKQLPVELAGSWTNGQVWTVKVDGESYTFTTPDEPIPGLQRLSRVASGLADAINANPPVGLEAVAVAKRLTIRQTSTVDAVTGTDVDNPFTFEISRGNGSVRVLLDIDDANVMTGSRSFTYKTTRAEVSVTETDSVDFTSIVTAQLYNGSGVRVLPTAERANNTEGTVDRGSNQISDVFNEYLIGQGANTAGRYYVVIGSQTEFATVSNRGGVASPFSNSLGGVADGLVYTANISIENQPSNENELSLTGARLELAEGAGSAGSSVESNQSGEILSYDPNAKVFVVKPTGTWTVDLNQTTGFDIFETEALVGYADQIINDTYTLRLSGAPTGNVTLDLLPERTRTLNSEEAFNPIVYYGEQSERQVRVATKQAVIRVIETPSSTWTVTLRDINGAEEDFSGATIVALAADIDGSANYEGVVVDGEVLITTEGNDNAFYTELNHGANFTTDPTNTTAVSYIGKRAEIEFLGTTATKQSWTLELDGKTIVFKITDTIASRGDLGRWIQTEDQTGDTYTFNALVNSGPRLTTITTQILNLIDSEPAFSDYSVERTGRILQLEKADGMNASVSVNNFGLKNGAIRILPVRGLAVQQVVFDSSNYADEQIVHVEAIDDDFIDGGDALVFAALEERVNTVRGPITINGGFGETDERFLTNPVLYPGETNEPLADGNIEEVGSERIDGNGPSYAFIEDLLTTHINANTGLRPGFDPRMNDFPYTVEFLNGRAEGGVYRVLPEFGVSSDIFSLGSLRGVSADIRNSEGVLLTGDYFTSRVSSKVVNSDFLWNTLNYTFKGDAELDETWSIDLKNGDVYTVTKGNTYVNTVNGEIRTVVANTLGRMAFALRNQIEEAGVYDAQVRVGLLGEVNLLLSAKDGSEFFSTISRSSTKDLSDSVTEGGFTDDDPFANPIYLGSVAFFANLDKDFSQLVGETLSMRIDYLENNTLNQVVVTTAVLTAETATVAGVMEALRKAVSDTQVPNPDGSATQVSLSNILNPAVSGRRVTFESDWLLDQETGALLKPLLGNDYYYSPLNANFDVEETDQVDVLNVFNGDSPSDDVAELTDDRLTGLGIGGDTVIGGREIEGGIAYKSLEEINIELGTGNDSLVIHDTHAGLTTVSTGEGNDRVAVANTSGTLNIEGDAGNDTLHIATSDLDGNIVTEQGLLETIMGHLTFDGGDGSDRMTVDDRNDSSAEVGTLTEDALTGYGFGSIAEVQTLTVIGQSGFYRISRGDVNVPWYYIRPGVARPGSLGVVLDVRFTAAQVQDHLEYIYGFGNVSVTLISSGDGAKTYGIEFIGQLSGSDIAPIRWADPGPINLVANDDVGAVDVGGISLPNAISGRADVIIGTRTSATKDPSGGNTQQFLEIVNADRGTFTITLLDQETDPLPFDITLEKLIDALQPILNPNNSDPSKPSTNNFGIEKIESRFLITFKGEHRDLDISGVDIDVTDLRGGTVELATRKEGLSYFNLETLDLTLGDGSNVLNIQGTSAITNVNLGGGDDEIYISSLSDIDFTKREPSFIGNLDRIQGTLNIDGGTGVQRLLISDASSLIGDTVSIINRLPFRGLPGQDLTQLDAAAELFVIGASPAPISIQADRVDGSFRKGFRIETGSGDDTVNITSTISRNRIVNAAEMELDTGLGNDNVFASLTATGNSPLIIRTQGEFNYRMRLRSGLNIANLTNPEDEISVIVDGVRLTSDQFRAVIGQNAIDLKIDGNLSTNSVVEAQLSRVTRGRVSEVLGQREYVINYQLREGETVKLFSAGQELRLDTDYFFYQIRPQQFILVFNGRFNFFRNGDIVWEATRILSEFQTLQSLGQRDDDFVNASGSTLPLTIFTGSGDDVVIGGQGDDVINSGRGDDIVFGRSGSDQITSVEGNQLGADFDIIFGDDGIVKYQAVSGEVTIDSRNTGQGRLPSGDYRLLEILSVEGGMAGDDILGSGIGDDILIGGLGNDQLRSGEGNDVLIGDSGRILFNSGHRSLIESMDSFNQSGTNDLLSGGDGANYLIGGLGNDEILTGFTDPDEFSLILGDLGQINFEYDASTGINSVTGMLSSYPGIGGDDEISSNGSSDWIIAGLGSDQVSIPTGAFLSLGIGALSPIFNNLVQYLEWSVLNSVEDSTGGSLIVMNGFNLEENNRPIPNQSGLFGEP